MGKRSVQDLVSYRALRQLVGWLGILFPFVLVIGCAVLRSKHAWLDSISAYTAVTRNVLVGFLFAVAAFLLCYQGYDWRDNLAGNLACVFMLGVAMFPCTSEARWMRVVHYC